MVRTRPAPTRPPAPPRALCLVGSVEHTNLQPTICGVTSKNPVLTLRSGLTSCTFLARSSQARNVCRELRTGNANQQQARQDLVKLSLPRWQVHRNGRTIDQIISRTKRLAAPSRNRILGGQGGPAQQQCCVTLCISSNGKDRGGTQYVLKASSLPLFQRPTSLFSPSTSCKRNAINSLEAHISIAKTTQNRTCLSHNTSSTMVLTGHCLCKAVTYSIDVDAPLITGYDHCDDCQRQSGSTYCK